MNLKIYLSCYLKRINIIPNIEIRTFYQFALAVAHIKAVLELANITHPHIMPIEVIIRCAHNVVNIILKKNIDSKLMTLAITQAYILLLSAISRKSFKGKKANIRKNK